MPQRDHDQRRPLPSGAGGHRQHERIYARRRVAAMIVIALVLLGLGAAVIALVANNGAGGEDAAAESTPTATAESTERFPDFTPRPNRSGSKGADADPKRDCGNDLSVTASTDRDRYEEGFDPVFTMTVENVGSTPCTANLGTSQMRFVVSDTGGEVFNSVHCQSAVSDDSRVLQPDQQESVKFTWKRNRTESSCQQKLSNVGAGLYRLKVSMGDAASEDKIFELT